MCRQFASSSPLSHTVSLLVCSNLPLHLHTNILIVMSNMVTSAFAITHKIARISFRRGTHIAILSTNVFHPLPCIPPLAQSRVDTRWNRISIGLSPSFFFCSLSLSLFSSSGGREAERTRNRLWIGGFTRLLHWRAFHARGGSTDEGGSRLDQRSRMTGLSPPRRQTVARTIRKSSRWGRELPLSWLFRPGRWKRPHTPVRAAAAYASRSFPV